MPFGLFNASATFERLMEKVLRGILNKICLVYLDNVIIFSKTFEEIVENLWKVFICLKSDNLKVNPKKCSLFSRKVRYLDHIVSGKGVTDPEKISAVKDWPTPRSKKQLRGFLGFCCIIGNSVRGFSLIVRLLFELT